VILEGEEDNYSEFYRKCVEVGVAIEKTITTKRTFTQILVYPFATTKTNHFCINYVMIYMKTSV